MTKRRIHLTEGQLYGLVEQALNELDWKTYMNAANKRAQQHIRNLGNPDIDWNTTQKYSDSADALADWAAQTFDKRYGKERSKFFPSAYSKGAFQINAPVARSCRRKGYFEPVVDYDTNFAMKDIDDYVKGEQTYQNGYWHSNNDDPYSWVDRRDMEESINRKMNGSVARRVTESVMRKLRRM